ncbi:C40 family peptidase [Actinomycetospora termitidis]|uniref:C40 family peptidase n=1 Tax=Actinomycetospora termitidis TaxID=3053470 RepID=A0ABT7M844_9PSEU|nr:C40 family peptidase [Actinomycetospora sp. Odt1-22]MDL5156846.1 C40 family peptidase [Actinomycetospora sp. Odt1-22]
MTPRSARPDARPGRRTAPTVLAVLLLALVGLLAPVTAGSAAADPIVPPGANDVVRSLADANARAEAANEAAMGAREQLPVRRAEADRTRKAADAARGAVSEAREALDRAYVAVDQLTRSTYQGGDLDQLGALLSAPTPQAYLDKVELLDTVSEANRSVLQRYLDASSAAESAQADADARATDARRAADDAARTLEDAARTKAQADRDVAAADAALGRLSRGDRALLRGGGVTNYPTNIAGNSLGVAALRAALSRQGAPYVWGATGPNTFDCSGLVQWAYRQIGVGMPRVAAAQQQVGQLVDPAQVQVGDLIFFGSPATHVGIYVGGGRFLEAPQSGDVVKVAPVRRNVSTIRRISPP